jgi:hypothetical protein
LVSPWKHEIISKKLNHGRYADAAYDEFVAEERKKFFDDSDHKFGDTGESFNDLVARGELLRKEILEKYSGKTVVVVTHGHPVKAFIVACGGKRTNHTENAQPHTLYLDNNTGKEINLHRPYIDKIELPGKNGNLKRIPEVLDVWMDSASMPYAQVHYPFENQAKMEASFPADFIAEYTGQIRAWFYVMHAIGVMVK